MIVVVMAYTMYNSSLHSSYSRLGIRLMATFAGKGKLAK